MHSFAPSPKKKKKEAMILTNAFFAHTVQRLVCVPPGPLGHGRFYHELPSLRDVPHTVRRRKALDASPRCPASRYGFLHWTRGDRGSYLRRTPTEEQDRSLLAVVGECLSRIFFRIRPLIAFSIDVSERTLKLRLST